MCCYVPVSCQVLRKSPRKYYRQPTIERQKMKLRVIMAHASRNYRKQYPACMLTHQAVARTCILTRFEKHTAACKHARTCRALSSTSGNRTILKKLWVLWRSTKCQPFTRGINSRILVSYLLHIFLVYFCFRLSDARVLSLQTSL